MVLETIKERKKCNISKLEQAKKNIEYIQMELGKNLKYINDILSFLKKLKKIKHCFNYIKTNWYFDNKYVDEIRNVEERITIYLNFYEKAILKRKVLKLKLKQAQREFTKKQKSLIKFEKKHFNKEV